MRYSIVLRFYRLARGLSQQDVADRLGLKDPLISRWENSFSRPDLKHAARLARIYGVTMDELFGYLGATDKRGRVKKDEQETEQSATPSEN